MSADRAVTVREAIASVAGTPRLAALERSLQWAVLFTVAVLPLSEAAKNLGFGVSLALYLAVVCFHDRRRPPVPLVGAGLLGLLGATTISALASEYPYHAARGVWEVFRHVSFFFIALRAFRGVGDIRRFVWAVAGGMGAAALIFFYQYFVVGMPLFRFLSLGGKNGAAQFLVMVVLLLLSALALVALEPRERWVLAAPALASLLVLGVSNAHTMWLAFVFLGLGLALWLRRWVIAAAAVGLALVVSVVAIQDQAVRERLGRLATVRAYLELTGRPAVWQKSLQIWADHPWFGVGPRSFKTAEDVTKDPVRSRYGIAGTEGQAHNLWVHTAAEMGTLGVLAVLGWAATVVVFLWRMRGVGGHPWVRALWFGAVGAFGAMMIAGITEPAIGYEHSLLLNAELALLTASVLAEGGRGDLRRQGPGSEAISPVAPAGIP